MTTDVKIEDVKSANPRGGRPPKSDGEKRDQRFTIRATIEERGRIEKSARSAGLSVSDYLRKKALSEPVRERPVVNNSDAAISALNRLIPTVGALHRSLAPLNNNINQIATYLHAGRSSIHWMEDEREALHELRTEAKKLIDDAQQALNEALQW